MQTYLVNDIISINWQMIIKNNYMRMCDIYAYGIVDC